MIHKLSVVPDLLLSFQVRSEDPAVSDLLMMGEDSETTTHPSDHTISQQLHCDLSLPGHDIDSHLFGIEERETLLYQADLLLGESELLAIVELNEIENVLSGLVIDDHATVRATHDC